MSMDDLYIRTYIHTCLVPELTLVCTYMPICIVHMLKEHLYAEWLVFRRHE